MPTFATAIQIFIVFILLRSARRILTNRRLRVVVRGLGFRHFASAVPILVCVVAASVAIYVWIPITRWGWWRLISGGQEGGVVAPSTPDQASVLAIVVPTIVVLLVGLFAPLLALWEERQFRRGSEHDSVGTRLRRQLHFGLAHLVLGIPIAGGLALSLAGAGFMRAYLVGGGRDGRRGRAVLEATRTHLAYNWIILVPVLLGLVATLADTLRH